MRKKVDCVGSSVRKRFIKKRIHIGEDSLMKRLKKVYIEKGASCRRFTGKIQ